MDRTQESTAVWRFKIIYQQVHTTQIQHALLCLMSFILLQQIIASFREKKIRLDLFVKVRVFINLVTKIQIVH